MQLVSNMLETGETEKELFFVSKQGYISVKISELRLYLEKKYPFFFNKMLDKKFEMFIDFARERCTHFHRS